MFQVFQLGLNLRCPTKRERIILHPFSGKKLKQLIYELEARKSLKRL